MEIEYNNSFLLVPKPFLIQTILSCFVEGAT